MEKPLMAGYMNRSLDVDLSSGRVSELPIDDEDRTLYLGGKGIGTRLLYDHTPAGLDPYDPEMVLIFSTGPLTATRAPQSNRFVVTTKSPLTGAIANSTCGGSFASKLKKAGVDVLLIRGRADHPVYLEITEDDVLVKDAGHLWGKGAEETQELLPKAFGKAVIGPAGENLVRYACIVSDERLAGRTGCGAVMGSKNLKAVIATGRRKVEIMDDATFSKLQTSINKYLRSHPMTGDVLPRLGTANLVNVTAGRNILPVNNFQRGTDRRAVNISGEKLAAEEMEKRTGCINCPIVCGRSVKLKGKITKGPEFETLGLMGANLGNFDLKLVLELNQICDDMGMDSISTGGSIGFATELTQRGLLSSDLSFDRHEGICDLVRDIAHRRGLGDDLADGVKRMSEKYGGKEYAIHVKGLELPSYDPRGCYGQGLEYATTNRGGCHVQGSTMFFEATGPLSIDPLSVRAKPQLVVMQQNLVAAVSSSVFCVFATYAVVPAFVYRLNPQGLVSRIMVQAVLNSGPILTMALKTKAPFKVLWFEKFLSYIFGRRVTLGEFIEIGERVFNMERQYNVREGFTASDDTLPARLLNESTFSGVERGVPLDTMLPRYYRLRGWDPDGMPTEKTLKRLQIRH